MAAKSSPSVLASSETNSSLDESRHHFHDTMKMVEWTVGAITAAVVVGVML
jgi:hypothetical protein